MENATVTQIYPKQNVRGQIHGESGPADPKHFAFVEDVEEAMWKVVGILNHQSLGPITAEIARILEKIPRVYTRVVSEWTDDDELNILHHSILGDHSDTVEYLLQRTPFFPPTHSPSLNPYAHLAALLGHSQCLRSILIHRPNDFFAIRESSHFIKLPRNIKKKLKLDRPGKLSKVQDQLLGKIRQATQAAEAAVAAFGPDVDLTSLWLDEEDAQDMQTARLKRKQSPPKLKIRSGKDNVKPWKDILKGKKTVAGDGESPTHFQPKTKPYSSDHLITVYRDVFSEATPGIINTAGRPVKVTLTKEAHTFPPGFSVERLSQYKAIDSPQGAGIKSRHLSFGARLASFALPKLSGAEGQRDTSITMALAPSFKKIEMGVRGHKKYKDFHLKWDEHAGFGEDFCMNKTPLALAAERGHLNCVHVILEIVVLKNNPLMVTREALTLATKARSPEAIVVLLDGNFSPDDYQAAVLVSIQELFPDCLTALLTASIECRQHLFGGRNLYHILYSQSLMANYRYEMMPEMTRVLIQGKEDVNASNIPRTFPLYTLISCAFHITTARQVIFYVECLKMLLDARANPHFNEDTIEDKAWKQHHLEFQRQPYYSAISCILDSAKHSVKFFENSQWSTLFLKKFITTIENYDRTRRRVLNDILFDYMDTVCELGLDRTVLRSLLRYGANPDFVEDENYAINLYFENLLPYLTKFEVVASYSKYQAEINDLMLLCRYMTYKSILVAQRIFLKKHLLDAPVQGIPLCRYFAFLLNEIVRTPQKLQSLAALVIWKGFRRNAKLVRSLPLKNEILACIVP